MAKKIFWLTGVALVAVSHQARAQDDQTGNDNAANNDNVIIVTATRRASDVQDIPIAVTAVTPAQLDQQGITNIQTLGAVAPSFNIQSSQTESQGTSIRIRGVGTTGNNIGLESAVGVFIDGVYQSRPGVALGELVDVEQVEVLRGPQGTLFGRNTTAGALVVRNKAPEFGGFGAFLNATYGNFDLFNVQGAINAPLGETVAARITGSYRERDGFLDSAVPNVPDQNDRDRYLIRGQLLFEPTADISFRLIGDYQKTDERCCDAVVLTPSAVPVAPELTAALFPGGVPTPPGTNLREFPFEIDRVSNSQGFLNSVEQWGLSGELNWDLGGAELTVIGSYRDFRGESTQDDFHALNTYSVGGGPAAPTGTMPTFDDIKTWTAEARLQGSAFEGVVDWLVGGFYSDEQIVEVFRADFGPDYTTAYGETIFGSGPLLAATTAAGNFFLGGGNNPLDFVPSSSDGAFAENRFDQDGTSFSVFTHNIINLTDEFNITLGARYVDDKKDGSFNQIDAFNPACAGSNAYSIQYASDPAGTIAALSSIPGLPPALIAGLSSPVVAISGTTINCFFIATPVATTAPGVLPTLVDVLPREFDQTFEDDEFIYTIQAGWEPNPDLLIYAGFTHGYKAGGFNLDPQANAVRTGSDPQFASEEIDAYELGIKSTLLNGRVRANLAFFYSDLADFQVLEFTGTQFETFNVDDVTSKGFELEVFAQWSDYISNSFAVTYTDAGYGDECDRGGTISQAITLCGASLTNAPEWVGIFGMTYDGPINSSDWSMLANVNIRYESDRRTRTNPFNGGLLDIFGNQVVPAVPAPFDVQDAHFKVNARLGFTTPDERLTFEVWGVNLTDEITRSITFNTPLIGSGTSGTASASAFIEEPRTYGVTVRARFGAQ